MEKQLLLLSQDLRPRHFQVELLASGWEVSASHGRATVRYSRTRGRIWILAGKTKWAVYQAAQADLHRFSHWIAAQLSLLGFQTTFGYLPAYYDEVGWRETEPITEPAGKALH